jgi:hypothetical protein
MRSFIHAVQKLHGDEAFAVVLTDFVNRADVGMVQGGRSTGFATEAFERLRVFGYSLRMKLQRYEASKFGVLSFVDDTHPAAAEPLDDAVMRDRLADHMRECYGVRSGMSMYGLTATSRTPPWLPSGWECRGSVPEFSRNCSTQHGARKPTSSY